MSYVLLKHLHVTCVLLSGAGFAFRGVLMLQDSSLQSRLWVRVVPHMVDTMLLLSALSMAFLSSQYPFVQHWLTAKFFALLVYIVLGSMALKQGRTRVMRRQALIAALLVYIYMVTVAVTRNPLSYWG